MPKQKANGAVPLQGNRSVQQGMPSRQRRVRRAISDKLYYRIVEAATRYGLDSERIIERILEFWMFRVGAIIPLAIRDRISSMAALKGVTEEKIIVEILMDWFDSPADRQEAFLNSTNPIGGELTELEKMQDYRLLDRKLGVINTVFGSRGLEDVSGLQKVADLIRQSDEGIDVSGEFRKPLGRNRIKKGSGNNLPPKKLSP